MKSYTPVIGLEIHVELKTETGMFCQCKVNQFESTPNSNVCPVCLGMPGALPVPNRKAIEWTIKIGQALNCRINKHTKFDRKHYSYPDLPKGYQISQYDEPIAVTGHLDFDSGYGTYKNAKKSFRIHRVHLEEDTGKLTHTADGTLVDFNRSGTPLVEIVTEPDFESADDVKMFLEELHAIIRYLDVSDADMEKGTMRMEPNISLRITGTRELPKYKVEVKNINSFNFVKRAIEYEVKRHAELLEKGETPVQETRGWDSNNNRTYSQRTKEDAHDYRYFPEPDIPPFEFTDSYIESVRKALPELPADRMRRFMAVFGIRPLDAYVLSRSRGNGDRFEQFMAGVAGKHPLKDIAQKAANYFINKAPKDVPVPDVISAFMAGLSPRQTDSALLSVSVEKVITAQPKVVADYRSGKQNAIMFLVGQVMREMKGGADAKTVIEALKKRLA